MKVVVAANGPTLDSLVAKRFGHAPCYLLVDAMTMPIQVIEAIENNQSHDESHALIPQMAERGVELFITGNIGPVAFKLTRSLKCRVALARQMSAGKALTQLSENALEILSAPTVKHSHHNHSHHTE